MRINQMENITNWIIFFVPNHYDRLILQRLWRGRLWLAVGFAMASKSKSTEHRTILYIAIGIERFIVQHDSDDSIVLTRMVAFATKASRVPLRQAPAARADAPAEQGEGA